MVKEKYKKSKYVFTYDNKKGGITFFNAVNLSLLEGDKNDLDVLTSYEKAHVLGEDETSSIFLTNEMIVDESVDEENELIHKKQIRYKKAKEFRTNRIGYMRISLTEHCNMACKYCFVDRILDDKANMSEELFTKIMAWFIDQNKGNRPLVQYFGGEPLLRMDLVKKGNEMLKVAKENGILEDYMQEIVTNGTLLTEDIVSFMINNKIDVSVSIDGVKEIHDKNRIFKDGSGSFDKVIEGLQRYKKEGGKVSLFITPTEDNIEQFDQIIPYFVEQLHANEISVNTPQPYKYGWEVSGVKVAEALKILLNIVMKRV